MKAFIGSLLFIMMLSLSAQQNIRLVSQLDSMKLVDQKWRGLLRKIDNSEIGDADKDLVIKQMKKVDSTNHFLLSDIFEKYGYPSITIVGKEGAHNFWLLIQHQDNYPKFQMKVLEAMESKIQGNAKMKMDYAYLMDRVKLNSGEKQVFGTQMMLNGDKSSYIPKPLVDSSAVNERRAKHFLPPIEKYIEMMNKRYFGTLRN